MKIKIIISAMLLMCSSISSAELLWSPKSDTWNIADRSPGERHNATQKSPHSSHKRPKEKAFYLSEQQQVSVSFIAPDLTVRTLLPEPTSGKYILPKSGMDNYHALIAEQQRSNTHNSSLRYISMRGKPSGHSPEKLIKHLKLPLEIVPEPMIREHWKFYTSNKHTFLVLFKGQPLADTWVILRTSNGTTLDAQTDQAGHISFILPEDFKQIKAGRRANKPAEMLLQTVHINNNITYKTNFNAPYYVNPSHWQSNIGGISALSLGFISGLLIMFRHNRNNNKKSSGKSL